MATVFDVAQYIIQKTGPITAMKLQKLVYYCQAWSLVWDDQPLFDEKIEAWANGPVIPQLFSSHKGQYIVDENTFLITDVDALSETQKETIDIVLRDYGNKSSQYLIELSHSEDPWKNAREGLEPGERGNSEINLSSIFEYYSLLFNEQM